MVNIRQKQSQITPEQAMTIPGAHPMQVGLPALYSDGIMLICGPITGKPGDMERGKHFTYKFDVDGPKIESLYAVFSIVTMSNIR